MSTWDEVAETLERAIWRYSRGGTLQALMSEIKGSGSVAAAAKRVGVDRRTWQRWNTGSSPRPATMSKIREAAATARLPKLARQLPDLGVTSRYQSARERRTSRVLDAAGLAWRPDFMRTVLAHHTRGNRSAAARAFIAAIMYGSPDGSAFYRDWLNPDNDDEDEGFDLDRIIWH